MCPPNLQGDLPDAAVFYRKFGCDAAFGNDGNSRAQCYQAKIGGTPTEERGRHTMADSRSIASARGGKWLCFAPRAPQLASFGAIEPPCRVGLAPPILPCGCKLGSFCTFGRAGACTAAQIGFVSHIFSLWRTGPPAGPARLGSFRTFRPAGSSWVGRPRPTASAVGQRNWLCLARTPLRIESAITLFP